MKIKVIIVILFAFGIGMGFSSASAAEDSKIPAWVKGVANFWVNGNISDDEFLEAIEFLIKMNVMTIESLDNHGYAGDYASSSGSHDYGTTSSDDKTSHPVPNKSHLNNGINSFEQCAAVNDVMTSYPRQCVTKDGEHFWEELPNDDLPPIIDDYPYGDYFDSEDRKVTQIGDEYWNCYQGNPVSPNCTPFDYSYYLDVPYLEPISGYKVACDTTKCMLTLDEHYDTHPNLVHYQGGKLYQEIFDMYVSITPQVILDKLNYFYLYSDDYYGSESAATYISESNPLKMELSIDPADVAPGGVIDKQYFKSLMTHENAHMFSLISSQHDNKWIDAATDVEMRKLMKQKQASCAPNYYNDVAGCMNNTSYLNLYFQKFWSPIYADFKWSFEFDTDDAYFNYHDNFVKKYKSQFVSPYATTMPDEDFAESFTAFVMWEKPTGKSVIDQKVLFFYDFPEIVKMRDFIRSNL